MFCFMYKVINRPKIVSKEDEDENLSDSEAAKLAWSIHLSVNNSIIVDIFQVYNSKFI